MIVSANMMQFNLLTPADVALELRDRVRKRRLGLNMSQAGLAERSGVNLHSIRRFEIRGMISLESLLKIALVLDFLGDFDHVGAGEYKNIESRSLDDVLAINRSNERRRGRGR